jgi:hypothetical protein
VMAYEVELSAIFKVRSVDHAGQVLRPDRSIGSVGRIKLYRTKNLLFHKVA